MHGRPKVLVIAGSDSSGGAGLQRDLAVLTHLGVGHASVVTAVTAQTDQTVAAIHIVPQHIITAQLSAALAAGDISAVKIGMLGTKETIGAVAKALKDLIKIPIILDPVLVSSSGRQLLDEEGETALVDLLFPLTRLITPNLPEAARLCRLPEAETQDQISVQAEALVGMGAGAVLLKGGHGHGPQSTDTLIEPNTPPVHFSTPRLKAAMRGTGCALSSAIAGNMAMGATLPEACEQAKTLVNRLIGEHLSSAP